MKSLSSKQLKVRRAIPLLLMTVPGVIYLVLNNYIPMFGIIIAFKNIDYAKGILRSDWIGFKNFEFLFRTQDAFIITRNTILYNVAFIVIMTIASVAIAILLNEVRTKKLARFYQSVVLLPFLISMVIVGYLVFSLLSLETGMMNKSILPALGIPDIQWYSEPKFWPFILTTVNVWKNTGYFCVIYYAAVIGIDREMYEAAEIDGASKWQQILRITMPMLKQVIIVMTMIQIGRIFYADFGLFYQVPMNAGALSSTTNVIDTYVYRALLNLGDISMASAAGVYQSIVGFLLVISANAFIRRIDPENALF